MKVNPRILKGILLGAFSGYLGYIIKSIVASITSSYDWFPAWLLGRETYNGFYPAIVGALTVLLLHKYFIRKDRYYTWAFFVGFIPGFLFFWIYLFSQ